MKCYKKILVRHTVLILNPLLSTMLYCCACRDDILTSFTPHVMKKSFTYGAIAGATSLAIALPMLAQFASAATATTDTKMNSRPVPTQACILALAERDTAFLANVDAMIAAQKAATIAHRDALTAAAAMTSDADRQEALKKAHEDMQTAMKAAFGTQDRSAEMAAMKTACGDSFHGGMWMGMKGMTHPTRGEGGKKKHGGMMNVMQRGEMQKQK